MTGLRVWLSRAVDLIARRGRDERLNEEFAVHLDLLTDDYVRRGMKPEEARLAARRAFGAVDQLKMTYREQRGLRIADAVVQDVRLAARLMVKDRSFTVTAVLVLALAIGVNTTVFTIINGMTWRTLPVDRAQEIMQITSQQLEGRRQPMFVSLADFHDWQREARTFAGLAAYTGAVVNVGDGQRAAERLAGLFVSHNTFQLLGVQPLFGRDFVEEDDRRGAPPVAILGHHVWRDRYAADPSILQRTIRINGVPTMVIGVMPEGFRFPVLDDLWQPLLALPALEQQKRSERGLRVFGRLAPGATLAQARTDMEAVAAALAREHPDTNAAIGASVVPFVQEYVGTATEGPPLVLMLAGALVLLIACANTANLLLSRAVHRLRELALRAALGASRARIVRQLLVESLILSAFAATVSLVVSVTLVRLFERETVDLNLPFWIAFEFDRRVFVYLVAVAGAAALMFGLAPAWHVSKTNMHDLLKEGARGTTGSRRARRWSAAFLIGELALTFALLAGAALLVRSGRALYEADSILDLQQLVTARLALPRAKFMTPDHRHAFTVRLQERLDANPAIEAVTVASARPFVDAMSRQLILETDETVADGRRVQLVSVGEHYFETLKLPVRGSGTLDTDDSAFGQHVMVINDRLASLHFRGANAIGQRVRLVSGTPAAPSSGPWLTVVGVVPSVRQQPMGAAGPVAYVPLSVESPRVDPSIIIRAAGDFAAIASVLREEGRALDPDVAVYNIERLEQLSQKSRWTPRMISFALTVLAAIAAVMAAMGLYAVSAHAVAQRTSEIGIRTALGARRRSVVWLVLRRTLLQVGIGIAVGVAGALALGQVIQGFLVQTSAHDPLTLGAIAACIVVIAALACLVPARRAMRLDPVAALRHE